MDRRNKKRRTPEEVCQSKKRYVDEAAAEVMLVKYRTLNKGKKRGKGKNIWENHHLLYFLHIVKLVSKK